MVSDNITNMRGTTSIFDTRWVRTTAYSLLGILMFLGLWQGLSKVFAQMPPPATTICAIMPDFCPSSTPIVDPPPGGGGSPSYTINKEIVNADGTPNSQRIFRPGDEIKYKITVTKNPGS